MQYLLPGMRHIFCAFVFSRIPLDIITPSEISFWSISVLCPWSFYAERLSTHVIVIWPQAVWRNHSKSNRLCSRNVSRNVSNDLMRASFLTALRSSRGSSQRIWAYSCISFPCAKHSESYVITGLLIVLSYSFTDIWSHITLDTFSSSFQVPVTILGSENCQSILFQNLLSASQAFQGVWLNTVNWGCKAAAVILPDYCTPHKQPFMSLCPDKAQGYKVKVQSENNSASHFSSQPVMMTGWLVSGIVYASNPRSPPSPVIIELRYCDVTVGRPA